MKKITFILVVVLLVSTGCSSSKIRSIYNNDDKIASNSNSYNLSEDEQEIVGKRFSGKVEFEGMDTIWTYESEDDIEIEMTYLLKLKKGKAKLVLISPDGSLTNTIEVNKDSVLEDYAVNKLSIKKGLNRIKLVAANAKIEFDISIDYGTFSELGF